MRWWWLVAFALAGCGGYESYGAYTFGYGPGAGCAAGDADCAEVEAHLDVIRAEWGGWCGTVILMEINALEAMGERAVPTLIRELDAESRVHALVAAKILERFSHRDPGVTRW